MKIGILLFVSVSYQSALQKLESLSLRDSECVRDALSEALPVCAHGVDALDPTLHKISAVKLSICEFRNAGILYPKPCDDINQLSNCLTEIEKSTQYWTTFSGYYRGLHTFCHEESLPYEKDNIIFLFSNITRIYKQFQEEMLRAQEDFHQRTQNLTSVSETLDKNMKAVAKSSGDLTELAGSQYNVVSEVFQQFLAAMEEEKKEFVAFKNYMHSELHSIKETSGSNLNQMVHYKDQVDMFVVESQESLASIQRQMFGLNQLTTQDIVAVSKLADTLEINLEKCIALNEYLSDSKSYLEEQKIMTKEAFQEVVQFQTDLLMDYMDQISTHHSLQFKHFVDDAKEKVEVLVNSTTEKLAHLDGLVSSFANITAILSSPQWIIKIAIAITIGMMVLLSKKSMLIAVLLAVCCGVQAAVWSVKMVEWLT